MSIGHTGVVTAIIQDSSTVATASSSEDQRGYDDANTSPECPRSDSGIRTKQQLQQQPQQPYQVLPFDPSNGADGITGNRTSTSPSTTTTSSDSSSELSITGGGGGSDGTGASIKHEFAPTILKETITTGGYR